MQRSSFATVLLGSLLVVAAIEARLPRFVCSRVYREFRVSGSSRVKLHHMESAHDQLFKVGSQQSIAFARKYPLNGPIPESLTNYLDVRKCPTSVPFAHPSLVTGPILRRHWHRLTRSTIPCGLRVGPLWRVQQSLLICVCSLFSTGSSNLWVPRYMDDTLVSTVERHVLISVFTAPSSISLVVSDRVDESEADCRTSD